MFLKVYKVAVIKKNIYIMIKEKYITWKFIYCDASY